MVNIGQTGTGKTWTMEGNCTESANFGIIPRATKHLFKRLHEVYSRPGTEYDGF